MTFEEADVIIDNSTILPMNNTGNIPQEVIAAKVVRYPMLETL